MFGKLINKTQFSTEPVHDTVMHEIHEDEESVSKDASKQSTIVARDTVIRGNIEVDSDIQVYGEVIGNINTKEGSVRIMHSGHVEGEITAPVIIIDGRVDGMCRAKTIDILDHGELKGSSYCENLSIKAGGGFIGQSEKIDAVIKGNNKVTKITSSHHPESIKSKKELPVNTTGETVPNLHCTGQ